jgi:hypothetical protein
MKSVVLKIKPDSGFSHILHIFLTMLLPALLFVLVRIGFVQLAAAVILLSKWRMFAVRLRYWPANIRANAVDLIVGISILIFMVHSGSAAFQLSWAAIYGVWLLAIKPGVNVWTISLQAMLAQLFGIVALFLAWGSAPLLLLVIVSWMICYASARHFFTVFDEQYSSLLSHAWAYFAAAVTWVLGHWLLFYGVLAQPALILTVIGYGLAALYYLDQTDKLSPLLRRQFVFIMIAIVTVVLVFSEWGDKTI